MVGMTTVAGIQELARVKYEGTHDSLIVTIALSVGICLWAIVAVLHNAVISRTAANENNEETDTDMTKAQSAASSAVSGASATARSDEAEGRVSAGESDLVQLRKAISLAEDSKNRGSHPFASTVVAADGTMLASAGNNSLPPTGDPTQHAELRAASAAARQCSPEELAEATLYTSAEPCVMCTGAVYWTGIGRIVYALSERRLLELTGDDPENPTFDLPCREVLSRGQRVIEVVGPVLEDEAAAAHEGFWTRRTN